jgi:hypothetical protein
LDGRLLESLLRDLYVHSPAAFFEDSIFSPPLLPKMLTKPRTVCFCQPVASMISGRVAPLARCIMAMTSAFLFVLSAAGLQAAVLAAFTFFAGLACLVAFAFVAGFAPLAFLGFGIGFAGLRVGDRRFLCIGQR